MSKKRKKQQNPIDDGFLISPSAKPIHGVPENTLDILNAYGEYNVQKTADTENDYPKIEQS